MRVVLFTVQKRKTCMAAGAARLLAGLSVLLFSPRCRGRGLCGGSQHTVYTDDHECDWQLGPDTGDGSTRGACHRTGETRKISESLVSGQQTAAENIFRAASLKKIPSEPEVRVNFSSAGQIWGNTNESFVLTEKTYNGVC